MDLLKLRSLLVLILLISGQASSHTQSEMSYVCPIGGQKFTQVMAGSGTSFGATLDFKPYGPIASPWPLPVCPDNGFVMYRFEFSKTELELIEPLLSKQEYKNANPHYRAYLISRTLGEEIKKQFNLLLQATWKRGDQYRQEALELVSKILEDKELIVRERINLTLLKGEFERRLGFFEDASKTFDLLETQFKSEEKFPTSIVSCQKELIANKHSSPSPIPNQNYKCGDLPPFSM
jgi:hypothetical protein